MNILVIEDDPQDADAIVTELEAFGFAVERYLRVDSMTQLREALRDQSWDVFVCDYVIPEMTWKTVLEECQQEHSGTPFIVVSGKRGEEYAVEVMRAGAQDYVTKQKLVRLAPAVQRELDQVALQRSEAERQRALESELTRAKRLESTGKLAGGLAHNLNNALSTILGNLDLAVRSDQLDQAHAFTRRAQHAIGRASRVVRQLNNLTAEPEVSPIEFDLNQLVDEVLTMLEPVIPESVTIRRSLDQAGVKVTTDPFAVEQILVNLVLNARDAVSGEGWIECRTSQPASGCQLTVADSGEGISAELQPHIFEPFFTTKAELGTGMGLASVDQLVNALNGKIELESAEGAGARFTVSLPDLQSVQRDQTQINGRVLIVHAIERVRFRLHGVLRRNGVNCESLPDTADAQSLGQFDLALVERITDESPSSKPMAKRIVGLVQEPGDVAEDLSNVYFDESSGERDIMALIQRMFD